MPPARRPPRRYRTGNQRVPSTVPPQDEPVKPRTVTCPLPQAGAQSRGTGTPPHDPEYHHQHSVISTTRSAPLRASSR